MTSFTITYQGVPVGTVEFEPTDQPAACAVALLPAYEAIRPIVRAASAAIRAGAVADQAPPVSADALHRGAALGKDLELHDSAGRLVPTAFIELAEWPGEVPEVRAWIGIRGVPAGQPARKRPCSTGGSESAPPAA